MQARTDSFCHALFERAVSTLKLADHDLVIHDLYAEGFDPVLKADEAYTVGDTIEAALSKSKDPIVNLHREEIAVADGLLVAHPNWWGKPPAILAGWLDRVLVPGVAYRLHSAEGEPYGLLSIKAALILNTSDTPSEREAKVLGDPLHLIWENCVLPYCGAKNVRRRMFGAVAASDLTERQSWLAEVETVSSSTFPSDT
ncbi:MAG: NAD(P)H-dependent oxidoreductase [Granulosicoccus sp.]